MNKYAKNITFGAAVLGAVTVVGIISKDNNEKPIEYPKIENVQDQKYPSEEEQPYLIVTYPKSLMDSINEMVVKEWVNKKNKSKAAQTDTFTFSFVEDTANGKLLPKRWLMHKTKKVK